MALRGLGYVPPPLFNLNPYKKVATRNDDNQIRNMNKTLFSYLEGKFPGDRKGHSPPLRDINHATGSHH